ncbi:putative reverse transcriptase domain-containing protein [Tanacetum coccineum]
MAILVISISSNSSDESVGSSPSRIILFGTIPVETPTIPSVVPTLPHISPFLAHSLPPSSPTHDLPPDDVTPPAVRQILPAPLGLPHRPAVLVLPDNFLSDDSSPDSSSDSSSDYSSDSSSGHSIPDSSFSPKDSSFDAPATISARPSHKRCRFPAASVLLATLVPGALSPVRADLLLPRRRIREVITISDYDDSTEGSYEAYIGPDIDSDVQANIDADTAAVETAAALEVGIKIEADVGVEVGIRIKREDEVKEEAESRDRGTIEIGVDRVLDIESAQREQGHRMVAARGNGDGNPNMNVGGIVPVTREYTYQDFLKCQPLFFKGTKGVVGLTRWFQKMETVFYISNCPLKYQVKYASCTLQNSALTWWNSQKRTIRTDVAYTMTWKELMKLMTEELILLCTKMVPKEEDKVEKYIGGLPDNIQGNVIAVEPIRLQDTIRISNHLMDQKLKGYAAKNAKNKRRFKKNPKDNRVQQPPFKRHGHYKSDWPNLKNQNHGNKNEINEAKGKAYVLGGGEANPDSIVITGTFLLNNRYASVLFNLVADQSFVSTTFSALLNVVPSILDISYAVELADGRVAETNIILRGCTLGLLGHPFNIDLMPVELGSFDVIIGMDWMAKYHATIICDEKVVRIPYGNKVLIIQGDGSEGRNKSRLSIISCTKTEKYIQKGCQVFLAQKQTEDKSRER